MNRNILPVCTSPQTKSETKITNMSSSKPVVTNIEDTLEQHRTRLEASVGKLRKALRQWQTYSAEYEGFKEELQELPENASRESMVVLRHYSGN